MDDQKLMLNKSKTAEELSRDTFKQEILTSVDKFLSKSDDASNLELMEFNQYE